MSPMSEHDLLIRHFPPCPMKPQHSTVVLLVKYFCSPEFSVQASAKTSLFWLGEVARLLVGAYKT